MLHVDISYTHTKQNVGKIKQIQAENILQRKPTYYVAHPTQIQRKNNRERREQ